MHLSLIPTTSKDCDCFHFQEGNDAGKAILQLCQLQFHSESLRHLELDIQSPAKVLEQLTIHLHLLYTEDIWV